MAKVTMGDHDLLLEKFRRYRTTQNLAIRDGLVLYHRSLVERLARKFLTSGEPLEDLIQEGSLGLIKAVDQFDPDQAVKFETYATHKIAGEIRHYLRDLSKLIQEPGWHAQLRYRVLRTREHLTMTHGYEPLPLQIAQVLGMDAKLVEEVLASGVIFKCESLDEPVMENFTDEDGEEERTVIDKILELDDPYPIVDTRLVVRQAIRQLTPLKRVVIYHFFYRQLTKTDIAQHLGISINYVSYLVKKALQNLRKILSTSGFEHLGFDDNGHGPKYNRVADRPPFQLTPIQRSNYGGNKPNKKVSNTNDQDPARQIFSHLLWLLQHQPEKIRSFAETCHRLTQLARLIASNYDHFALFAQLRSQTPNST